jgi:hypothetical protein
MIEVYWPAGALDYRQPYTRSLDVTKSDEQLLEQVNPGSALMRTTITNVNTQLEVK